MKIRKMKSNLDERQELKLLKIEHNGCWIAFWGLLIVMLIQKSTLQVKTHKTIDCNRIKREIFYEVSDKTDTSMR